MRIIRLNLSRVADGGMTGNSHCGHARTHGPAVGKETRSEQKPESEHELTLHTNSGYIISSSVLIEQNIIILKGAETGLGAQT